MVGEAAELIREFVLRGGKRIRPVFAFAGWRCGTSSSDRAVAGAAVEDDAPGPRDALRVCAALELVQACALIHDDIIDHSDTRRGRPSVHHRFAATHRERGWSLEARDYGLMGGILAGDLCLSFSEALFAPLCADADPAAEPGRARKIFDLMRTEVMGGQYLDGLSEHLGREEPEAALERAFEECRLRNDKLVVIHSDRGGAGLSGDSARKNEEDLKQVRSRLDEAGVEGEVRGLVRGKEPAEDLIVVAEETDASLIIIGLRKRTPVGKLILGSNAQRILLDASCPVLAVKS